MAFKKAKFNLEIKSLKDKLEEMQGNRELDESQLAHQFQQAKS
jgi:hypothetical protein